MNWKLILLTLGAFALIWAAFLVTGVSTVEGLQQMVKGSMGSARGWTGTLREMTPLLLLGIAVFVGLRAGLFNIGADGQFNVGALCGVFVALKYDGPGSIFLALLAGCVGGALWAWPAGLIKAYRGGHEVITTIMLNNLAFFLMLALIKGPLKDPEAQSPTSANIADSTKLPYLLESGNFKISLGWVFGIVAVIGLWIWLKKTVSGYELEATGANPKAAETAGVKTKAVTVRAMLLSGMVAGFAGAVQVTAFEHRIYSGFSPGYGFDALGVALLAGNSPIGLLPSSLLFSVISKGVTSVSLLGVPKGMNGILIGLVVIVFAAVRYRKAVKSNG